MPDWAAPITKSFGSGCELCDSPGFERYRNNPDRVPAEKLKTEIYIPLK